ncbi:MAG: hypothetical protein V1744_02240 [Candidatus Altiarchaeota archaeon]
MPSVIEGIYRRVSDIWSIPFEEITPTRGEWTSLLKYFGAVAGYSPIDHKVDITSTPNPILKIITPSIAKENILSHELGHSAYQLINPDVWILERQDWNFSSPSSYRSLLLNYAKNAGKDTFDESLANVGLSLKQTLLHFQGLEPSKLGLILLATHNIGQSLFYPLGLASYISGKVRDNLVRSFYKSYGPDGFILLSVDNPHRMFQYSLRSEENRYLTGGILYPSEDSEHKGLTPKGEEYVLSKMSRERLLMRLQKIKEINSLLNKSTGED